VGLSTFDLPKKCYKQALVEGLTVAPVEPGGPVWPGEPVSPWEKKMEGIVH